MASAMIHLAIAKKVNEKLKYDQNLLFLGTHAPDLSSILKISKAKTVILDTKNVYTFINDTTKEIINNLKELEIL